MSTESEKGAVLITLARAAIGESFGLRFDIDQNAEWLQRQAATFVTLKLTNQLRGCIGTLQAHRALGKDVYENARAAAFRDPRFAPVNAGEFDLLKIEVSLLSEPQTLSFDDEADALARLRPNLDGLIFQYRQHRSTFLPQVWAQLPDAREFMAHLKQKAGLSANFWSPEVNLKRYTVSKWSEQDFKNSVRAVT